MLALTKLVSGVAVLCKFCIMCPWNNIIMYIRSKNLGLVGEF